MIIVSDTLVYLWLGLAIVTFILLTFGITAQYGRHFIPSKVFPRIDGRNGWILQELCFPLSFELSFYLTSGHFLGGLCWALFLLHYTNRALIDPLVTRTSFSSTRADIVLFAIIFNIVNGTLIGAHLAAYPKPNDSYKNIGLALFFTGMFGNIWSDRHMSKLRNQYSENRKGGCRTFKMERKGKYVLPITGPYRYVISPNYGFEMVEWFGMALLSHPQETKIELVRDCSVWAFVFWTVCNLAPRGRANLRWYKMKFGENAVGNRRAIVPFVY